MKKKQCVSILIVASCILIFMISYPILFQTTLLVKEINKAGGFENGFKIVGIEKMQVDAAPISVDVDDSSLVYSELWDKIDATLVKYKRTEIGLPLSSVLYTFTAVSEDSGAVSVTVDNAKTLHINNNNTTYAIVGNDSGLYEALKTAFAEFSRKAG